MKLKINKRFVKAGDVVEVAWEAGEGNSPRLIMHMGGKESALAVPENGSKKFRLKGAKGAHWIGLKVWIGDREEIIRRRIFVYGRKQSTDQFEYIDRGSTRWSRFKDGMRRWWNSFSGEKKRLYIILLLLLAYQILFGLGQYQICSILFTGIIVYIFWQIIKR